MEKTEERARDGAEAVAAEWLGRQGEAAGEEQSPRKRGGNGGGSE